MQVDYRLHSPEGLTEGERKPFGSIDISIENSAKEIYITNYENDWMEKRKQPLINLFEHGVLIFAGSPDDLFQPFRKFTTSQEVADRFQDLIAAAKPLIYNKEFQQSEDFNTKKTDLETLGILVSKFCALSLEAVNTVCNAALEDSNIDPIEAAIEVLSQNGYLVGAFWCKNNIRNQAEILGCDLTPDQIDSIAAKLVDDHSNTGINWDVIQSLIHKTV